MALIQTEMDAKACFLRYNGDRYMMCDCCTETDMAAYLSFATPKKERTWRKEGFLEHYTKIVEGQYHKMFHFTKMVALYQGNWWEFLYRAGQILWNCPLTKENAEKVFRILLQTSDDEQYAYTDEQRVAMFTLAESFVDKFQLTGSLVRYLHWYRMRLFGVHTAEEAAEFFKKEGGFPQFRTTFAKQSYDQFMTSERLQEVSQAYFWEIIESGTDGVRDFQTIFRLFTTYPILTEQNVQKLYHYLTFYTERIRSNFWANTVIWIVQELIPMLLKADLKQSGKEFLYLATRLIQEDAVLEDLPAHKQQTKELVLGELKSYHRELLCS